MIDIWTSSGLRIPRELDLQGATDLPIDEEHFLRLSYASPRSEYGAPGIWAEMAKLARIWAEIQVLNKASVDGRLSPNSLNRSVDELAANLDRWQAELPEFLVETPGNLTRWNGSLRTAFAALHLGFHFYNEVLFYQFLAKGDNGGRTADVSNYAQRCTWHALAFCDLLYACEDTEDCDCLYVMVGHMLTVTSTVYVHTLLFSFDEGEVVEARTRLERNFAILTKLQRYWIMLDRTLSRLQAFHNACKESIEQSFQMDSWMLRFIMEHGTSLPEKFTKPTALGFGHHSGATSDGTSSTGSPVGVNLQEWYSQTFG